MTAKSLPALTSCNSDDPGEVSGEREADPRGSPRDSSVTRKSSRAGLGWMAGGAVCTAVNSGHPRGQPWHQSSGTRNTKDLEIFRRDERKIT